MFSVVLPVLCTVITLLALRGLAVWRTIARGGQLVSRVAVISLTIELCNAAERLVYYWLDPVRIERSGQSLLSCLVLSLLVPYLALHSFRVFLFSGQLG